jgi:dTDP-4-amino-4,6-dideoxy-D-galactose acyltransferase
VEVNKLCEYLGWDSEFFGRRIARAKIGRLDSESVRTILDWCHVNQIDCLYFLADANDLDTMRLAEDNHFRLVDIRVSLERRAKDVPFPGNEGLNGVIRPNIPDDVAALRDIAKRSYRSTRFYSDSNFPPSLADALYETWIEKSCNGYADAVLVAEMREQPAGYVTCHLLDETKGQIGLVGVGSDWRGNGLGQALVNASLHWFADRGIASVTVVTQGRNYPAQRLYQRCGFLTSSLQLWYHRWFTE